MATLTIIPYAPKPPNGSIRKPPSKFIARRPSSPDKNLLIDSSDVPVEVLPALGGAARDNNWSQKAVSDNEAAMQDVQVFRDHLVGTRSASIAEKDGSDDDTDDEFPSPTRLLSSKYKHVSAEERSSVKSTAEKGNDQDLYDTLIGSRGSRAPGSYDEPVELGSDNESEGDDSNLDSGEACLIVGSGQPGCDAFNSEHPLTLSNRTAHEHNDDDISSGDGDSWPKRRKVSAQLGGGIASNSQRSQRSPSPISEEDEDKDDETLSSSADGKLASTARAGAFESPPLTEPQLCPQVIDANQDWEVRQIIGKEDVDGVLHYLVDWYPTLLAEHSLGHAKELVDMFEARLRAQRRAKKGRGGSSLKPGRRAVAKADVLGCQKEKKPRGRPRKQT